MRILICDDDPLVTEQLDTYLHEFFNKKRLKCPDIAVFHNGEELLEDTGEKDILFLDIEMPGMDGIHAGTELKKSNPKIIIFILTSYMEYLDEAMRFQVFRYFSKPLDKQRLFRNMKDALQVHAASTASFPVETKQGAYTIPASDIVCVEAQGRSVTVHTTSQDYISVQKMRYWADALKLNCFFQSHRSFIINMAHVNSFDHTMIHLHNDHFHAYLTRRKYTEFRDAYLLYLESTR